jgi:hypothetical protein
MPEIQTRTDYLSEDAFIEMIATAQPGEAFVYAIGDVAYGAAHDPHLFALRKTVQRLADAKVIALTQRKRRDQLFAIAGCAFEYIATKREEVK